MNQVDTSSRTEFPSRLRWSALVIGVIGVALGAILSSGGLPGFVHSYLYGWIAVWLLPMGALGLLALANLTGGRWAIVIRPALVSLVEMLPLVTVGFLPIALAVEDIYPWFSSDHGYHFTESKEAWLSKDFFLGRAIGYFVIWHLLAIGVLAMSRRHQTPGETLGRRRGAAFSIVLLVLSVTGAAFDWGMSLEPEWYSSIYGAWFALCGVLAAQAFSVFSLNRFDDATWLSVLRTAGIFPPANHAHADEDANTAHHDNGHELLHELRSDVGNLMLAFVMLWTYFALSQFLIIWAGNLPSEISWYLPRVEGGWGFIALVLVFFHFVIPFLLLFSRDLKRSPRGASIVAAGLLAMLLVNMYWTIQPSLTEGSFSGRAADVLLGIGMLSLLLGLAWWRFARRMNSIIKSAPPADAPTAASNQGE